MGYRNGERDQAMLLPSCIEEYVPVDAPVRAYDAIVEAMDLRRMGIEWKTNKPGCPQYNPKLMLKLLVYGYAYGVRSSRKLERETHYNLSFIWLMGGLKPDHKTIAEFRRRNKEALKQGMRECARMCLRLGLIEGNALFVDGSKFRANASRNATYTPERCEKELARLDARLEEILAECETMDRKEGKQDSLVRLQADLADQKSLRERVEAMRAELEKEGKSSWNATDPECTRVHGRQGSHAGYNGQIVVDGKAGLIVACDVVNQNNDLGQLGPQMENAKETLERPCETACGDAGYANYEDLQKVEEEGLSVVVPSKIQAHSKPCGAFEKARFGYDAERDIYRCPAGQELHYRRTRHQREKEYHPRPGVCRACRYFGECTTSTNEGRKITRYVNEEFREEIARRYASPAGQAIYRKRKEKVELPFGHIKRNLGAGHFWLRGLAGVRAEMALLAMSFNFVRLINIFGVPQLIAALQI